MEFDEWFDENYKNKKHDSKEAQWMRRGWYAHASACQPHIIGRACEKCGSGDLYIRFRKASDELDTTIGGGEKGRAKTDCLFINCKICDYWWTEET